MIWSPPADLAPYVSGYHLYVVGEGGDLPHRGAFEPAWASLRIAVTDASEWRLRPAGGEWFDPPETVLFGPASALVWSQSGPGVLAGIGIRPRGWLRLFAAAAKDWANRIAACPPMGGLNPGDLRDRLRAATRDDEVPALFDVFLRRALGLEAPADEDSVGAIEAALVDPAIQTVSELAERTGLPLRRLGRLALKAFGFAPKLLLRRARFLRSLHAVRAARRGEGAVAIDPAYTDYSHFTRDSHDFLGMSPQAFLEIDMPLLRKSLALRTAVLGAPAQALDPVPDATA